MKKYAIINFLLVLIIVFLVMENYKQWTKPAPVAKENVLVKQKTAALPSASPSAAAKKEVPAPASFKSVSDRNMFSPDRKEFPIPLVAEAAKKAAASVRPNVQLFGVAIGEGFQSAVITNPTRRPNERETLTVKEGDRVGEYKVAKIVDDRITLESSGDSFDVLLYDPSKQKKRPAATPVATGPGPVPSPVPPRPYRPPAAVPPSVTSQPGPSTTQPGGTAAPGVIRAPIQRRTPAPAPRVTIPFQPSATSDEEDNDE